MSQVPEQQAGFVRVPKITTGADTPTNSTATSTADTLSSSSSLSSSDIDSTSSSSSSAGGVDVGGAISDQEQVALEALDIRVGRIVSCERHPDAERWEAAAAAVAALCESKPCVCMLLYFISRVVTLLACQTINRIAKQ